jgi:hypothetical protein
MFARLRVIFLLDNLTINLGGAYSQSLGVFAATHGRLALQAKDEPLL